MKQNKFVYYMYEICKLLIIRYIFQKNDSSTRTSTKPQKRREAPTTHKKPMEVGITRIPTFSF